LDLNALYDKISWAARTEEAVFFVGEGISHDYPSCLPLGSEIKDGVMHSLFEDDSGLLRPTMLLVNLLMRTTCMHARHNIKNCSASYSTRRCKSPRSHVNAHSDHK